MKKYCGLVAMLVASPAFAGGMTLPLRGVRALERGGAFVAGADDADALWLDPAGLAHAPRWGQRQLLFDIAYVAQAVDYTGVAPDGTALAPVENLQPAQLVPTVAGAFTVADRLVVAGGITAPYAGTHRYEADGPARYASVSLAGSTFVVVTLGIAYAVSDRLRVGATLQDTVSKLDASVVVSACPGQTTCSPEQRDLDSLMRIEQTDYISPSGSIGVQLDAARMVTLGLAVQAPSRVSATGTLTPALPTNTIFTDATITGSDARLAFTLPPIVRAGIELHTDSLRVEAALAVELWSLHDEIAIEPDGVRIDTVADGSFTFAPMTIPRQYKTSVSPSLGVEFHKDPVMIGAGIAYETAAAPPAYVSPLTVDAAKLLVGIGGGYEHDGWQIGAAAGFVKLTDVDVPLAAAAVPQLQPLRDALQPVAVNAGTYSSSYVVAGLRMARRF
jgi:long-chain fatty acid transport protein